MKRRDFITASLASAAALATTRFTGEARAAALPQAPASPGARRFRLNYAPSLGQFKAHAGTDLAAQVQFAADEGFTAMFDNGLMGRPPADQDLIVREIRKRNMTARAVRPARRLQQQELRHAGQGRPGRAAAEDARRHRDDEADRRQPGARRARAFRREPRVGVPDRQRRREPAGVHGSVPAGRPGRRAGAAQSRRTTRACSSRGSRRRTRSASRSTARRARS